MATYVILSKLQPGAYADPREFKSLAATVSQQIREECPGVVWKESFATMGRFDVVDIVTVVFIKICSERDESKRFLAWHDRNLFNTLKRKQQFGKNSMASFMIGCGFKCTLQFLVFDFSSMFDDVDLFNDDLMCHFVQSLTVSTKDTLTLHLFKIRAI